jgi:hypothetical protein
VSMEGDDGMDSNGGKAARRHRGPSALIRRLLQRVTKSQPPDEGTGEGPGEDLPPPGSRSGKGAASVEPYLNQTRNSRPGPLE